MLLLLVLVYVDEFLIFEIEEIIIIRSIAAIAELVEEPFVEDTHLLLDGFESTIELILYGNEERVRVILRHLIVEGLLSLEVAAQEERNTEVNGLLEE